MNLMVKIKSNQSQGASVVAILSTFHLPRLSPTTERPGIARRRSLIRPTSRTGQHHSASVPPPGAARPLHHSSPRRVRSAGSLALGCTPRWSSCQIPHTCSSPRSFDPQVNPTPQGKPKLAFRHQCGCCFDFGKVRTEGRLSKVRGGSSLNRFPGGSMAAQRVVLWFRNDLRLMVPHLPVYSLPSRTRFMAGSGHI